MKSIRIKCPAKINLTLEVVNKREDGFHNIKSIMQLVSLYDYLNIKTEPANTVQITLSGNSKEIPYNEKNLVYKAAQLFLETTGINSKIDIYIEKNIPIAAGLAGGSTDAAGTIFGLNELFNKPLSSNEMHMLCSQLGSDLNVCLAGGCLLATSRGEEITRLKTISMPVTLIKPKHLGISAKEAYTKYSQKTHKPKFNHTENLIRALNSEGDIKQHLYNDLEYAVFDDYPELQYIKSKLPDSIMSGSGSTYFILENLIEPIFSPEYEVISELEFIQNGISIANCNNFVIY